jgi:hypothetical protein
MGGQAMTRVAAPIQHPTADGVATAKAGEVIFHRAGVKVVYQADEDAELVYVSHPALRLEPVEASTRLATRWRRNW